MERATHARATGPPYELYHKASVSQHPRVPAENPPAPSFGEMETDLEALQDLYDDAKTKGS